MDRPFRARYRSPFSQQLQRAAYRPFTQPNYELNGSIHTLINRLHSSWASWLYFGAIQNPRACVDELCSSLPTQSRSGRGHVLIVFKLLCLFQFSFK
jgi:hypothetical protein